jgi:hypothetical protein
VRGASDQSSSHISEGGAMPTLNGDDPQQKAYQPHDGTQGPWPRGPLLAIILLLLILIGLQVLILTRMQTGSNDTAYTEVDLTEVTDQLGTIASDLNDLKNDAGETSGVAVKPYATQSEGGSKLQLDQIESAVDRVNVSLSQMSAFGVRCSGY